MLLNASELEKILTKRVKGRKRKVQGREGKSFPVSDLTLVSFAKLVLFFLYLFVYQPLLSPIYSFFNFKTKTLINSVTHNISFKLPGSRSCSSQAKCSSLRSVTGTSVFACPLVICHQNPFYLLSPSPTSPHSVHSLYILSLPFATLAHIPQIILDPQHAVKVYTSRTL